MRGTLAVIVVVGLSCGPGLRKHASPPKPQAAQPSPAIRPTLTFAEPATYYNQRTKPPELNALSERVLAQIQLSATAAGKPVPAADERLFLAMTALATLVPEGGLVPNALVEFALHANGVIEPSPQLLVAWGPVLDSTGGGFAEMFRPLFERILAAGDVRRIGIGAAVRDGREIGAVVVALQADTLATEPIPRKVPMDAKVPLDVNVPRSQEVTVLTARPGGTVELVAVVAGETSATGELGCGGVTGKMFVEIMTNNETRALFPVWCGVEPPRTYVLTAASTPTDAASTASDLVARINLERLEMHLAPLRLNEGYAAVAREHSTTMSKTGEISSPNERIVKQIGYHRAVGLVARAYGIDEVHSGFTDRPSTRLLLTLPGTTQIGIGVAYGKEVVYGLRELYVTYVIGPD